VPEAEAADEVVGHGFFSPRRSAPNLILSMHEAKLPAQKKLLKPAD